MWPGRVQFEGGDAATEWSNHCHKSFMENYAFTNHTMAVILGCESEVKEWGPPLGLPVEPNFNCTGAMPRIISVAITLA